MSRLRRSSVLILVAVVALARCKGEQPFAPQETTVLISATSLTFSAIGATQPLTAAVLDQRGDTMPGATITWSSNNTAVATVIPSTATAVVVTAAGNGSTQIVATSGALSGQTTVTVAQLTAQLVKVAGDAQTNTVGQQLPNPLVVQGNDANGNPIQNVTVSFQVTQGNGSVSAPSGTTGSNGRTQVSWMLGTAAGTDHSVTASAGSVGNVTFGATATAAAAAALVPVSGTSQSGAINRPLSASIVVRVNDQFGNAVQNHRVDFVVTSGGGSPNPAFVNTGANGQAQTIWTLGSTVGMQTMEARSAGLTGSPVVANVTAINLALTTVSPDTLVEGQAATLTGEGFDPTPTNNTVTIDGVAATVTAATAMQLTVTVPSFDCRPARDGAVQVTRSGATVSAPSPKRIHPASFVTLAVGEQAILQNPAQFCFQFRASAAGGDVYLLGVGAAAETPSATLPYTMTAVPGASAAAAPVAAAPTPSSARSLASWPGVEPGEIERLRASQRRADLMLREWERRNFTAARAGRVQIAAQAPSGQGPAAVPSVGDTVPIRVSNFTGVCSGFTEIKAVVRKVGSVGIWVTDINNPTTDPLTQADIDAFSATFDANIYAVDTLYLGAPSDLDANQRVIIVLTIEVNKIDVTGDGLGDVAGFVSPGDLFSQASCPPSNQGELFYSHVPDPNNASGKGARSKAGVASQMAPLIAHEFSHNIQFSRRVFSPDPNARSLTIWEAEGQAMLAEEVVGHSVLGNMAGQNYSATVALTSPGSQWYQFQFVLLSRYFGRIPGSDQNAKVPNAPEECTLFGNVSLITGCETFHFYGASWSFHRYIADRFGPSYPGTSPANGEARLQRDWIGKSPGLNGVGNIEALLGVDFDSLFTQWAAMLYVDDRVGGAAAPLVMSSWNIFDVFNSNTFPFQTDAFRLIPRDQVFAGFVDPRSVRGGSNAYTRLSSTGARPALAIRVRDSFGSVLGGSLRPQMWIVRLQ